METETKKRIIEAASAYAYRNGWANEENGTNGANKLASLSDVNISYISNMLNGVFTYVNSRKGTNEPIADIYFSKLAKAIGYAEEKQYWKHVTTSQFRDIIFELTEAKEKAATRVLIGEAGCGKSYTISKFQQANPTGTYVVTCFKEDTLPDLLGKIETALRIASTGSRSERIGRIARELYKSARKGEKPVLIFDESESLTGRTFGTLKSLYDSLNWICSIVLIGTDDLIDTLERAKRNRRPGMPQFYRRFKAGIRPLKSIDVTFGEFFSQLGFELDTELKKTLKKTCENYGELHDFLEPALKKAEEMGELLTDSFFRNYHKLNY